MRLFVSHSVADKALVSAVIDLLEGGMGIRPEDIFCTSFDEQGIPAGKDFAPFMRERIQGAEAVVAIISPQYYESAFCLCETGGAWAIEKTFIPLLVEPVDYDDLRGALYGRQGLLITVSEKLDALRDTLSFLGSSQTTRWNRKKKEFLEKLPQLLKELKPIESLKGEDLKKLRDELAAALKEGSELDEQNEELMARVAALEKLKNQKGVGLVRKQFSTEDQQFEELVDEARDAIAELPAVAREAMRMSLRKDYFNPKAEDWGDEVQDAIQRDYLLESDSNVELNEDHPDVEAALQVWYRLRDFAEEASADFVKQYRKARKQTFNVTSLTFWEDHGLLQ